ncbi:MAG: FG-GAP-like repeat-containing protein, partial [Adhaeribacter sp.]
MKSLLRVAVVVLAWLALQPAMAQQHTFRYRDDVKVIIDSDTLKHPWVGGLNSPVFSRIDLDLDGTEDLFAFDRSHQKIYTFLARRQQGTWQWQYAPAYEYLFPRDLDGWVLLRDYDRDGRRDLFTKTAIGIKVYRNTSSAAAGLGFTEAEPYLKFNNTINLQVSSENLPFIGDLDQDGDLDILTFDFASSSTIEYYQNLQADQSLPANRFQFTLASSRWGGLMRCHSHECHAYVFNAACRTEGTRHNEGTTLSALDLDGDGDRDLLLGGESCPELARITNSGTLAEGRLAGADLLLSFPENSTPAILPYFPAAYHEDLNFDGLADLLVAPFARTNNGDDIDFSRSAWFYQNEGSHSQPLFTLRQRDFLQHDMIDAGEQSAPALADLDGDGDQDLLVGTRPGRIWFFRNVGTAAKAVFHLESRDYQQLSVAGFRDLKLQLSDLNGDGRPDLVLAGSTATGGAIAYILNAAPLGQEAIFPRDQFQTLRVPAGRPAFYDLDGDGDKDLVLAPALPSSGAAGMLQFYRNTGSRTEPFFELEQEKLGGIAADFRRRNPYPLLADLNRDNKPELLLADDTGELRIYSHIA